MLLLMRSRSVILRKTSTLGKKPGSGSFPARISKSLGLLKEPEHTDHEDDTLRITVEERTFVPTLLIPPFPETVIDELRGKYSKFRTRHDEDYVERKMEEDEEAEARKNLAVKMRTPLQEFHIKQKEEKEKRGEPQLTEDMLARIGEVIAANKARQQNATA
jgi:large subunit ribosomal protein L24